MSRKEADTYGGSTQNAEKPMKKIICEYDCKTIIKYAAPVIWLAVILLLSGQRGDVSSSTSMSLARWIRDVFSLPLTAGVINDAIRKGAHVFCFATEGLLIVNALNSIRHSSLWSAAICTAIAFADEGHKVFVPGRHCHPSEILLDAVSAALAIYMIRLISAFRSRVCARSQIRPSKAVADRDNQSEANADKYAQSGKYGLSEQSKERA